MSTTPRVTAIPLDDAGLPPEVEPRRLGRRALQSLVLIGVLVAVVLLAPGLGDARDLLKDADPAWLLAGIGLEALSCFSYVLGFRRVFCREMSWRTAQEIGWSELAMGSIVPASGAGGLALGAWALHRGGMPGDKIARRSVAFFLIKSSVNFAAVTVIGFLLAFGVVGPAQPLWRTALPATLALAVIVGVVLLGRLGEPDRPTDQAPRKRRWLAHAGRATIGGVRDAVVLLRSGDALVITGAFGYWIFDNAVLWATYHAVGASPPITVILMGYLIGQLGGALPIPGGVGGIDLGLVGALIVYGAPASPTVAAVLAYRLILFWLPLIVGAFAFWSLRRALYRPDRPDICHPAFRTAS